MVMTLVNGGLQTSLSVRDRGLAYGDGLFETIAVKNNSPLLIELHLQRLQDGCERLKIQCPDKSLLMKDIEQLLAQTEPEQQTRCVIKIIITRGIGGRGYRFDSSMPATRIVSLFEWPVFQGDEQNVGVKVRLCETRLSTQPLLAGIKHLNRLEQVMARSEWSEDDITEGVMLDESDNLIEGTMSNLFLIDKQACIVTPSLGKNGVAGVQRENILALAQQEGLQTKVTDVSVNSLAEYAEVFITNSLIGIWPVISIDNQVLSIGPVTRNLQSLIEL